VEAKLLIIGVLFAIYSLLVKKLKKKDFFSKKKNVALFYSVFWAVAGAIIAYMLMLNIPTSEGSLAEEPAKSNVLLIVAFCLGALYGYMRVKFSKKKLDKFLKTALEWTDAVYPVAFISAVIMYVFIQQFKIPSASMRTTFMEGDRLFVNKLIYGVKIPFSDKKVLKQKDISYGDIVIFRFPSASKDEMQCGGSQYGKDFIKRVVGLPGDEVKIVGKQVFVNGKATKENYARWTDDYRIRPFEMPESYDFQKIWENRNSSKIFNGYMRDYFGPVKVPENHYFVLGDNRDHSCDSRFWGPVPKDNIRGRAWIIVWPPKRIKNVH